MSNPWTQGPWYWQDGCSYRRLGSRATGKDGDVLYPTRQISDGHPDVVFPNGGYRGPDARLIAAAPEMAEMLQESRDYLEMFASLADEEGEIHGIPAKIDALLTRIRGGSDA